MQNIRAVISCIDKGKMQFQFIRTANKTLCFILLGFLFCIGCTSEENSVSLTKEYIQKVSLAVDDTRLLTADKSSDD